jgi:hypothetical protein
MDLFLSISLFFLIIFCNFIAKSLFFGLYSAVYFLIFSFPVIAHYFDIFIGINSIIIEIDYFYGLLYSILFYLLFAFTFINFKFIPRKYIFLSFDNSFLFSIYLFTFLSIFFYINYYILFKSYFLNSIPFYILWCLLFHKYNKINNIYLIYFFQLTLTFLYLYDSFVTTSRFGFVYFVFILFYRDLLFSGTINKKMYLIISILILFSFQLLMDLRNDRDFYIFNFNYLNFYNSIFSDIFIDRLNYIRVVNLLIEKNYTYPFQFNGYFDNLYGIIPRFLYTEKDNLGFDLNLIGRELGILKSTDLSTSIGISHVGESFLILNWFGCVLAIFLGIIFSLLDSFKNLNSYFFKALIFIFILNLTFTDSLTYIIPTLLKAFLPIITIYFLYILFRLKK